MKKLVLIASLFASMLATSCMETTYQNRTHTTVTDKDGNSNNSEKKTFHSENGKFSINFVNIPQGPVYTEEKNNAGLVQVYQYIDQVSDNAMYVAIYKDYPVGVITASNTDSKLKLEADNFMKNFGSSVATTQEERLNGNKGLSFNGTLNDTINIMMRSFFVGKRYYQFGTISANSEISDKAARKFINSFDIDN
ncbi:MAG: hypothetical protein MJZ66_01200 [Bacteroidales bacterium]|nr:hypothetical protein [Bacteroidales bacterium]